MKRTTTLLACVFMFLAALDSRAAPAPQPRTPEEMIAGTWKVTSAVMNGRAEKELDGVTLTFKRGSLVVNHQGEESKAEYKLDTSKRPTEIDIVPADGPDPGKVIHGIFTLTDEELKICVPNSPDSPRPKKIESKVDSQVGVMTLRREKR
jgi:uncharacterized protein (TIGR03067 family)